MRVQLTINNKVVANKDVLNQKMKEEVITQYKETLIRVLDDSDTWEIAIYVMSNFKNQKSRKERYQNVLSNSK